MRALFIGGPIDGQERVCNEVCPYLDVLIPSKRDRVYFAGRDSIVPVARECIKYRLLFTLHDTSIYSIHGVDVAFDLLWTQYAKEKQCVTY